MNKIIIDGYNLIHAVPELSRHLQASLETARGQLLTKLRGLTAAKQVQVVVVFDGDQALPEVEAALQARRLQVVFSRRPVKADAVIKQLVLRAAHKKSLQVVSDDREIVEFAKAQGAGVVASGQFYDSINKKHKVETMREKYGKELSDDELAEWLRIFGQESKD